MIKCVSSKNDATAFDAGYSYRLDYGPSGLEPVTLHCLAIVDGVAVCKQWRPTKKRWHHSCEHMESLEIAGHTGVVVKKFKTPKRAVKG